MNYSGVTSIWFRFSGGVRAAWLDKHVSSVVACLVPPGQVMARLARLACCSVTQQCVMPVIIGLMAGVDLMHRGCCGVIAACSGNSIIVAIWRRNHVSGRRAACTSINVSALSSPSGVSVNSGGGLAGALGGRVSTH